MRVAALYDIHGNLPALEAVLREVRDAGVERIVIGGDVLPGPMPRECLTRLLDLDLPIQFIQGNGDREVIAPTGAVPEAYRESMRWNAAQLSAAETQVLAHWPLTCHTPIDGLGDVLFCHATPRNDTEIFTRLTPDAGAAADLRRRSAWRSRSAAIPTCSSTGRSARCAS